MTDTIPIAQLARFGGAGRTAVVWWSHHDESIVGLYADLHIAIERRWRHVLHQLIACRPHLCPLPGPCRCDRPCTSTLAEILEAHTTNRGTDVAMHIDRGWPTHPGPDALADLMDRWAVDNLRVGDHPMTAVDTRRATVVTEIAAPGRGRRPGPNHRALDPDRSWVEHGACYNAPALADLFYPSKADAVEAYATARAVCARCDVRLACLDYAVATGETLGMWGGRTPKERREIARRRRAFTRRVDEVSASREDTPE